MDKTALEILKEHTVLTNQEDHVSVEYRVLPAMNQFAKQEAISFANWLAYNQDMGRETIENLYKRYSEQ